MTGCRVTVPKLSVVQWSLPGLVDSAENTSLNGITGRAKVHYLVMSLCVYLMPRAQTSCVESAVRSLCSDQPLYPKGLCSMVQELEFLLLICRHIAFSCMAL